MLHYFGDYNNKLKFHDDPSGAIKRFIGVEIEVADFCSDPILEKKLETTIKKWGGALKSDGSIDGNNPFEINTAPARGKAFIKQIREICGVLREGKAKINRSCGLHVHIDARDFEVEDLVKVAQLWQKIEPQLFKRVARSRRNNEYCQPVRNVMNDALDDGTHICKKCGHTDIDIKDLADELTESCDKYYALNCSSYRYRKTLENRLHHGTTNAGKIISWARLNSRMVEYAKKHSLEEIKKAEIEVAKQFEPIKYPIKETNTTKVDPDRY